MQKSSEEKPLTALEDKIAANAHEQARRELFELEIYLSKWSQDHPAGCNKGFRSSSMRAYDSTFTTPNELYSSEPDTGWKSFSENFIRDRAKHLAAEIATALLAKIELLP